MNVRRTKRYVKWIIIGLPLHFLGFIVVTLCDVLGMPWYGGYWFGFLVINMVSFVVTEFVTYRSDLINNGSGETCQIKRKKRKKEKTLNE